MVNSLDIFDEFQDRAKAFFFKVRRKTERENILINFKVWSIREEKENRERCGWGIQEKEVVG